MDRFLLPEKKNILLTLTGLIFYASFDLNAQLILVFFPKVFHIKNSRSVTDLDIMSRYMISEDTEIRPQKIISIIDGFEMFMT